MTDNAWRQLADMARDSSIAGLPRNLAADFELGDLGHAWAEAEAALGMGETLTLHIALENEPVHRYEASAWAVGAGNLLGDEFAPTPVAALRALTARLRDDGG